MEDNTILIFQILIPFLLIATGLIVGSILEKRHFDSIRKREKSSSNLPISTISHYHGEKEIFKAQLVTGSVVISVDYFKRILAALRNVFGGRVVAYESLVDRARREAILRMKAKCPAANIVINLKIETSSISKQSQSGQKSVGCVEVIAYGTAIQWR